MFGGVLLLTLCLVPSISNGAIVLKTATSNRAWVDYKSYFNKEYDGVTETLRKEAFMESLKFVIVRNLAHELSDESYQAGLNAVSDFTHDEIHCHRDNEVDYDDTIKEGIDEDESKSDKEVDYDDTIRESIDEDESKSDKEVDYDDTLRAGIDEDESESDGTKCMCGIYSLDWVTQGRVLPVGTQGCGDCYAWAATFALSSAVAIKIKSKPIDLSVQESKDCSYGYEINRGCKGGSPGYVYAGLVKTTKGKVVKTVDYDPYNENNGTLTCNHTAVNIANPVFTVKTYGQHNSSVTGPDDDCILRQQLSKGPVAANMCVSPEVEHLIHKNSSDIYSNMHCSSECQAVKVKQANHGVMIVGYTKNAWLVQNSWGKNWGYKGRAYFARGKPGSRRICNLATKIYWPIL